MKFSTGNMLLLCISLAISAVYGFAPMTRASQRVQSLGMGAMDINFKKLDGSKLRIGIIKSRWNPAIIGSLTAGVKTALEDSGVLPGNVFETEVPGAYELPQAAQYLTHSGTVDAVVCVGCLIKGDTEHFHYISSAVSHGLMDVSLISSLPVVFGVLTVNNEEQAKARAFGENNHGLSWGKTAVEMALLRESMPRPKEAEGKRL